MGIARNVARARPAWRDVLFWLVIAGLVGLTVFFFDYDQNGKVAASEASPAARKAPSIESVVVVGDSYAAADGASSPDRGWVALLAQQAGWNVENLARKGASYTETSEAEGCVHEDCDAFTTVLESANSAEPDAVIITGGRKDTVEQSGLDAARSFVAEVRARYPEAELIVLPPLWDDEAPPASLATFEDGLRAATEEAGGTYLEVAQPLTGRPDLIVDGEEGVLPNDAGHQAIAEVVEAALRDAGLASSP